MFKLASNINAYQEQQADGTTHYYVEVISKSETSYLINEIIYNFLLCFKEATKLETVILEYIGKTNAKHKDEALVRESLSGFFQQLCKKCWIVNEEHIVKYFSGAPYFKIADKIEKYKILKIIANNSETDVYLVKDELRRKKHVIKLINSKKFIDNKRYSKYETYFNNEFKFLNTFNSIYINKGYNYVKYPDYSYMVLEHINGKSLRSYVSNNILDTPQKEQLVLKLLKGFAVIHKNDMYHGDIHLSNVLITEKFQVKVIDFGYSNKAVSNGEKDKKKPRNGGVHAFIPPERALRSISRKFDAVKQFQSEVYQIGLLIYYVFAKELPFKSETWKTMVDEINDFNIHTYPPFLKKRMPEKIKAIIIKCLENNPELRYENAQALLLDWKTIVR